MNSTISLQAIRATVFLQVPAFSMELADSLHKILPDTIPSVVGGQPQVVDDILLPPGSWYMRSASGKIKLMVFPNKIDFIVDAENISAESPTFWESFCKQADEVFELIIGEKMVSRLAIAPLFVFQSNDSLWLDFIRNANKFNSFKGGIIKDGSFSQTYTLEELIDNKSYLINYIANMYLMSRVSFSDGAQKIITNTKIIEFDINTAPDKNYTFNKLAIKDFFMKASTMSLEFLNYYFNK